MKSLPRFAPLALLLTGFVFVSCDLATVSQPPSDSRPANHLVINEVFTLPESSPNLYSWIELYNPTNERIAGLRRWSLSYSLHLASYDIDTSVRVQARLGSGFFSSVPDTLEPGHFLVLFGDSISFYNHTNLGPGKGTVTGFYPFVMVNVPGRFSFAGNLGFYLPAKDELVLRDTSGNAVDVVRYGNYVPPSSDPFPGNHSAGAIPAWSSLSRYAGAFATGNSAYDFYVESRPIPMWYSALHHP
jgi:hypothetical protein